MLPPCVSRDYSTPQSLRAGLRSSVKRKKISPVLQTTYNSQMWSAGADPGFFFGRGCTRLLLYFNTNQPHSFFFWQNTSCIGKPQVISGRGGAHPLHPPPRSAPSHGGWKRLTLTEFHQCAQLRSPTLWLGTLQ